MDIFKDGQSITAFVKGTQHTFEGEIYTRDDGVRVVLHESGKWRRLADLEHVVRTGILLHEETQEQLDMQINGILDNLDISKVEKANKDEEVVKAGADATFNSEAGKKSGFNEDEIAQKFAQNYEAKKAEANAGTQGGDVAKAQNTLDEFKKDVLEESASDKLKDELGGEWGHLFDAEADIDYEDEDVDAFMDEVDPELSDDAMDADEAFTYEDPEYCGVSDSTARLAIDDVIHNLIEKDADEIAQYLADNYELSLDDAEELTCRAFEQYLDSDCTDEYDEENDEVDDEYEAAIDEYDGDPDELLDHLVDTFEIPEGDAEVILTECKGNRYEAVLRFAEYTRQQLSR